MLNSLSTPPGLSTESILIARNLFQCRRDDPLASGEGIEPPRNRLGLCGQHLLTYPGYHAR